MGTGQTRQGGTYAAEADAAPGEKSARRARLREREVRRRGGVKPGDVGVGIVAREQPPHVDAEARLDQRARRA